MRDFGGGIDRRRMAVGIGAAALAAAAGDAAAFPFAASRTLHVASDSAARFGRKQYRDTLPLADGEVVLTFDDGPRPATTGPVLDALAAAGARATFFLIGRNARANPEMVRRIAAGGHTLANHTFNHPWTLRERTTPQGIREIDEGRDAIQQAAGQRIAPFFRFPGFADTPDLLAEFSRRADSVWGADIWASDWNPMASEQQLALVMGRLRQQRRGIILMHDIQPQTARMMPAFLQALKAGGYRVVHAVG